MKSDDEIEAEQVRDVLDRLRRRAALLVVPTRLPAGLSEEELMRGYFVADRAE